MYGDDGTPDVKKCRDNAAKPQNKKLLSLVHKENLAPACVLIFGNTIFTTIFF